MCAPGLVARKNLCTMLLEMNVQTTLLGRHGWFNQVHACVLSLRSWDTLHVQPLKTLRKPVPACTAHNCTTPTVAYYRYFLQRAAR